MDESTARRVWLVRAFERSDADGRLLPNTLRERASRRARARLGERGLEAAAAPEAFLDARAEALAAHLTEELPPVRAALSTRVWRPSIPGAAVIAALVVGLSLNALGPSQQVNVLSFSLLGLLGWNLLVYVLLAIGAVRTRRLAAAGRAAGATLGPALDLLAQLGRWATSPRRAWMRFGAVRESEAVFAALRLFTGDWVRVAAPLHLARFRLVFHLGAAALIAGAVAGMYWRGLAFEYTATWQSTFLDADGVHALLSIVFWPAARLLGTQVELASIVAMGAGGSDGAGGVSAAPWIHLWAVTALVLVIAPRVLLALLAGRRSARLSRDLPLPLDDDYFTRLLAADRGRGRHATVRPYSFRLETRAAENLQGLLLDLLGNRATIRVVEPVPYGEPGGAGGEEEGDYTVLVFNLAQTPEQEVHGLFLEELRGQLEAGQGGLLVVLDETAYRKRMGSEPAAEERIAERRRAWTRLVGESGLATLGLALFAPLPEDALGRARRALWPRSRTEEPVT